MIISCDCNCPNNPALPVGLCKVIVIMHGYQLEWPLIAYRFVFLIDCLQCVQLLFTLQRGLKLLDHCFEFCDRRFLNVAGYFNFGKVWFSSFFDDFLVIKREMLVCELGSRQLTTNDTDSSSIISGFDI